MLRKWVPKQEAPSIFLLFRHLWLTSSGLSPRFPKILMAFSFFLPCVIYCGFLCCICRTYGTWVARNPALVLAISLIIVLVFCVGLTRFKVETRPEKVCYWHLFSLWWLKIVVSRDSCLINILLLHGLRECFFSLPLLASVVNLFSLTSIDFSWQMNGQIVVQM